MKPSVTRSLSSGLLLLACLFLSQSSRAQDVIMQGFYWNTHPGDVTNTTSGGIWWDTLATVAPQLSAAGFSTVWTPPPTKSFAGVWDMGYGMYDYFDLGSYLSKGTTRTRHGSRAQLDAMISAMHANNIKVMADVVLNHRGGADAEAPYQVNGFGSGYNVFMPPSNRIPGGPQHVHPTNQHPDLNPDYHNRIFFEDICHFNEADAFPPTNADGTPGSWFFGDPIITGSMGDSLIMWGRWLVNNVGYDELRLDAVKHIDPWYIAKFLVETKNGAQPYAIGESFEYNSSALVSYHNAVETSPNSGSKPAKISLFDFPLRGALKSVLNNTSGTTDLYNTLGNAGLVWSTSMTGDDVTTWLESHDTDRTGYVEDNTGCAIPYGGACLKFNTEPDNDPVVSDKEDMGYPFLLAAEGRPVVFWKDWYWYGLSKDIKWEMALRAAMAKGTSDHIQHMGGDWNAGAQYTPGNDGGNMFAMRRDGLTGGAGDGLVLGLNDDPAKEHAVWVNTPFTNKYLKDYSDGYLFKTTQAFGDSRALIAAQPRDYSWWSVTGLYPRSAGTAASHFNMDATPGGCPHFIAVCTADANNLIVNGAPIAAGDEVAVKNAAGQVVGIGRVGQGFRWDGTHDMIIEALGSPSTNGLAGGEAFRVFVYDQSAASEIEIGTVQYAASGNMFNFSPERPNSPNRNGNFSTFSVTTTAGGNFSCNGISRIVAFNTQVAVNQAFCPGDNASNSAYNDGWQNSDNGGTGFSAWQLSPASNSGSAGFFIGNSAANGDGDGNGDGDINTSGSAFGFYANSGGLSSAVRPFTVDLVPGATFSLKMDNGWIDNGSTVGFGLQNSSGENLLEFYFVGNTSFYQYNDLAGAHNTSVGFTDEGLSLNIKLTSATAYQLEVTQINGGTTTNYSGSLKNPAGGQSVHQLRLFNANAGGGGQRDAFFNSPGVCYPATIVINEVDYDQVGTDNMEFIELKNVGSGPVNLDNYKLELVDGGANSVYATVDLPNVNLAAGDYFVICGNGSTVPNCDFNFTGALTDRIQNGAPDAIRLLLGNTILVDALSYEGSVPGAVEGSGTGLIDNNTTAGVGLSRVPDGNDTNQNNSDFKLSCITPGNANLNNPNSDGDSYPDFCDNCPNNTNETQADTDIDGIGDACDACPLAVSGISNFNTTTCNCEPGYFPVTEIRNGQSVIIGCQPCPAGSYCPDGINTYLCPPGKYSNVTGSVACLNCAAGSYQDQPGQTSCIACEAGTFSNITGATSCTPCPAGTYNDLTGQTECQSCPAGKFSNVSGATSCTPCPAGSYNDLTGQTECQSCPAGTFNNTLGAIACHSCPAGTYNDLTGQTECQSCPAGTFNNTVGAIACQSCPAGTYNDLTGQTECQSCPAGKFSNVSGATSCTPCPAGTYNDLTGQTECQSCPAGYFSNVTGSVQCLACPVNTYSSSTGSTECDGCGSGFYSPGGSVSCSMCNVTFSATPAAESCSGALDGGITISNVTGGTAPFMYSIDNGASYSGSATFTGLSAGIYPVRVKDDFLCESAPVNVEVTLGSCSSIISGNIIWENDGTSGVKDATVKLTGDQSATVTTPLNGTYSFTVTSGSNFTITPTKNINKLNGITSADAAAIQQHVAGSIPITSPYKLIAADVNKSNSISSLDATIINQSLLGNPSALNQFKTSWRFTPTTPVLSLPPWSLAEKIVLTGVSGSMPDQDFFGIKTGDVVTAFADPSNFGAGTPFVLRTENRELEAGTPVAVTFAADSYADLAALQFALQFDVSKLQILDIQPSTAIPLTLDHFGTYQIDAGQIRIVWSQATGIAVEEAAPVFTLTFQVLQSGGKLSEALHLNNAVLPGYAYNSTLAESGVQLKFVETTGTSGPVIDSGMQMEVWPNPFREETTVSFTLPVACEAQLRVFDVNGRELIRIGDAYRAGKNNEILQLGGISATGVLTCELVTPFGVLSRKMVILR